MGAGGWASSYNQKYIRDCDRFWPERHIPGEVMSQEEIQLARSAYWPFGMGARKCVGMKVALNELHLTIARMVYLFEFTPAKPEEFKKNFEILDHQSKQNAIPSKPRLTIFRSQEIRALRHVQPATRKEIARYETDGVAGGMMDSLEANNTIWG